MLSDGLCISKVFEMSLTVKSTGNFERPNGIILASEIKFDSEKDDILFFFLHIEHDSFEKN